MYRPGSSQNEAYPTLHQCLLKSGFVQMTQLLRNHILIGAAAGRQDADKSRFVDRVVGPEERITRVCIQKHRCVKPGSIVHSERQDE